MIHIATPKLDVRELNQVHPQAEGHSTRDSISGVQATPLLPSTQATIRCSPSQQCDHASFIEPKSLSRKTGFVDVSQQFCLIERSYHSLESQ